MLKASHKMSEKYLKQKALLVCDPPPYIADHEPQPPPEKHIISLVCYC